MKKPTTHKRIAVLKAPKNVYQLVAIARAIVQAMGGNKTFPAPDPALSAITTAANDVEAAQALVVQRVKGAVDDRNAKVDVLVKLLHQEKGYVQKVSEAGDPAHAADVIQSAAFQVKHVPEHAAATFTATPGPVSGSARLAAPAAGKRASYEWEFSVDAGKTWQVAPPSMQARTVILGLQPGVNHAFRYRAVTKAGPSDWSEPVTLLVQ